MKKVTDVPNSEKIKRNPDKKITILSDGKIIEKGYQIRRIELRLYGEKQHERLDPYSLITSYVETDQGSVEMLYDEGYRGNDALSKSADFLINCLGVSGLILRSIIALQNN